MERTGGCACGMVRFALTDAPIITHACHCTWCQRETGSAFVVNAMIETDRVRIDGASPVPVTTPSSSGKGQIIQRCPTCQVAVWSHYAGGGPKIAFVRVGALDPGHGVAPDIHVFTSTRQPWLTLPAGARAFTEFYDRSREWTPEAIARYQATR